MVNLTGFGKAVRKYRIDKSISLKEMATGLHVTPAFLSGIETGRKAISPNLLNKISAVLQLTHEESEELNVLAAQQITELRIPLTNNTNAARLLAYARRLDQGHADDDLEDIFNGGNP